MGAAVEIIPAMTLEEAQYLDRRADETINSALEFVDVMCRIRDGEGWRLLGHDSWTGYTKSKSIGKSKNYIFRKLEAAIVVKELEQAIEAEEFPNLGIHQPSDMPESQLRALAKAPEGERANVLTIAAKAAEGRPTEQTVKAAVKAKKAKPEAPAAELVADTKTIVNGEAKVDKAVERARAEGRIPAGVVVEVEDPGDDAVDIEDVRMEHEEQAAKADDLTDEEWLASLPLTSKLAGVSLKKFKLDACYYRRFDQQIRRALKNFHGKAKREVYGQSAPTGFTPGQVSWLLSIESPGRWFVCPPTDKGGCGGLGTVPTIGDCNKCKGKGYLAR